MIKTTGNTSSSTASKGRSALGGDYTYSNAAGDFDVAVVNGQKQLQITNAPHTLLARNIVGGDKILRIVTGTHAVEYVDTTMVHVSESSGTYTVTLSGMSNAFTTGDDAIVNVIWPNKNRDSDLDADKVILQNPPWEHYTAPESYTTLTAVDLNYVEGAVIDTRTYNVLNYYYSKDSSVDDSLIKITHLKTVDGTVDYQETYLGSPSGGLTTVIGNVYHIDGAALVHVLPIPTNGSPFMRIDLAKKTDAGAGDDAIFTASITKGRV
jgi:hypothetical protein